MPPPAKGQSVTHVPGKRCYLCLRKDTRFPSLRFSLAQKFGRCVLFWSGHFGHFSRARAHPRANLPVILRFVNRATSGQVPQRSPQRASLSKTAARSIAMAVIAPFFAAFS